MHALQLGPFAPSVVCSQCFYVIAWVSGSTFDLEISAIAKNLLGELLRI